MGAQFLDLFAAGGYALAGRLMLGLGGASMAWLFCLLAAAGIVYSMVLSATSGNATFWLRHLVVVALAALLISLPQRVDLATLTYAAPGRIEALAGSRSGAAPHLTYAIERLCAAVAAQLRSMVGAQPVLAVPGIVAQVADLVTDPALLDDRQLRANLEIWRRRIVPQLLQDDPALADRLQAEGLMATLLDPTTDDARFNSATTLVRVGQLHAALAATTATLSALAQAEDTAWRQITDSAGADPWIATDSGTVSIRCAEPLVRAVATIDGIAPDPVLSDAQRRGQAVADEMIRIQPDAFVAVAIGSLDDLYRHLAGSILVVAGNAYLDDDDRRATLGALCQRAGEAACRAAQAPLPATSALLRVPDRDPYNAPGARTWLKQSLATLLLTIASVLAGALSSLVVAVLPFMLGVAKALAILLSVVGVWMLLWPGRLLTALAWIVGPVAFVGLWSILFGVWVEIEGYLSALAAIVGNSDHGSWSAGRIMALALSLGYLGLPTLALHILFGTAHGAMSHGGHQLEAALRTGLQHSPRLLATARRWAWRAPLVQRINRRIYAKFGLGALPARRRAAVRPQSGARAAAAAATDTAAAAAQPGAAFAPAPGAPPATTPADAATSGTAAPGTVVRRPRARKATSAPAPAVDPGVAAESTPPARRRTTRGSAAGATGAGPTGDDQGGPGGAAGATPAPRRRRKSDPPA